MHNGKKAAIATYRRIYALKSAKSQPKTKIFITKIKKKKKKIPFARLQEASNGHKWLYS